MLELSSGKPPENAYNGFMFTVRAGRETVCLNALRIASKAAGAGVEARVWCCDRAWEGVKDRPSSWTELTGSTGVLRGNGGVDDARFSRLELRPALTIKPGGCKALYIHTADIGGISFNSNSDVVTAENGHLQLLPGTYTGNDKPFANVSKTKWSFAGCVEYALPDAVPPPTSGAAAAGGGGTAAVPAPSSSVVAVSAPSDALSEMDVRVLRYVQSCLRHLPALRQDALDAKVAAAEAASLRSKAETELQIAQDQLAAGDKRLELAAFKYAQLEGSLKALEAEAMLLRQGGSASSQRLGSLDAEMADLRAKLAASDAAATRDKARANQAEAEAQTAIVAAAKVQAQLNICMEQMIDLQASAATSAAAAEQWESEARNLGRDKAAEAARCDAAVRAAATAEARAASLEQRLKALMDRHEAMAQGAVASAAASEMEASATRQAQIERVATEAREAVAREESVRQTAAAQAQLKAEADVAVAVAKAKEDAAAAAAGRLANAKEQVAAEDAVEAAEAEAAAAAEEAATAAKAAETASAAMAAAEAEEAAAAPAAAEAAVPDDAGGGMDAETAAAAAAIAPKTDAVVAALRRVAAASRPAEEMDDRQPSAEEKAAARAAAKLALEEKIEEEAEARALAARLEAAATKVAEEEAAAVAAGEAEAEAARAAAAEAAAVADREAADAAAAAKLEEARRASELDEARQRQADAAAAEEKAAADARAAEAAAASAAVAEETGNEDGALAEEGVVAAEAGADEVQAVSSPADEPVDAPADTEPPQAPPPFKPPPGAVGLPLPTSAAKEAAVAAAAPASGVAELQAKLFASGGVPLPQVGGSPSPKAAPKKWAVVDTSDTNVQQAPSPPEAADTEHAEAEALSHMTMGRPMLKKGSGRKPPSRRGRGSLTKGAPLVAPVATPDSAPVTTAAPPAEPAAAPSVAAEPPVGAVKLPFKPPTGAVALPFRLPTPTRAPVDTSAEEPVASASDPAAAKAMHSWGAKAATTDSDAPTEPVAASVPFKPPAGAFRLPAPNVASPPPPAPLADDEVHTFHEAVHFKHERGFMGAGNDLHSGNMTVTEAKAWCEANPGCAGFTFAAAEADPAGPVDIFFKSTDAWAPVDAGWQTYITSAVQDGGAGETHL